MSIGFRYHRCRQWCRVVKGAAKLSVDDRNNAQRMRRRLEQELARTSRDHARLT